MRRFLCWLLVLFIASAGAVGFAEEETAVEHEAADSASSTRRMLMLPGKIVTGKTVTVPAPFGGILADYSVRKGDIVSADESLFSIETAKVYAPLNGSIGSLGAQVGDNTAYFQDQYGAVMFIEPENQFIIETDTKEAYGTDENLFIHVGETVYIGSRNSSERMGAGFISAVSGKTYTVEVTDGNLVMDDNVAIYRSRDFASSSKIGAGKTTRKDNIPITAEGSIFAMHVAQGQKVKRGDLLFETVSGSIAYNMYPTRQVVSGYAAVVASVDATPGSTVSQNQILATLYLLNDFQIAAQATEAELESISAGDTVRVELTSVFERNEPIAGIVSSISGLNSSGTDDPVYTVYIDFETFPTVRDGMLVNVYFNEQ